jgi:hypothetical protein
MVVRQRDQVNSGLGKRARCVWRSAKRIALARRFANIANCALQVSHSEIRVLQFGRDEGKRVAYIACSNCGAKRTIQHNISHGGNLHVFTIGAILQGAGEQSRRFSSLLCGVDRPWLLQGIIGVEEESSVNRQSSLRADERISRK